MEQPPLLPDEVFEHPETDALAASWRLDEATRCTGHRGLRVARDVLARTAPPRPDADDRSDVAA